MRGAASKDSKPPPLKKTKLQSGSLKKAGHEKKRNFGDSSIPKEKVGKASHSAIQPGEDSSLPRSFKIVAGSYEKFLFGIEATFSEGSNPGSSKPQPILKPIFIFPAHVGCVKAVAASPSGGKWLATGSTDEIVKVWDLRRRKEIGGLMHHEGSITYLTFPSRSHLLSASEDGTLCLFRARDWVVLCSLKGHKGRVNCVAVHPSGKVALSVGKDRTLRMWDLMRGKGSASTKLDREGEVVVWSPSGTQFALQTDTTIDIYNTKMTLLYTITHSSRVQDVKFFLPDGNKGKTELLMVAAEDKKVTIYYLPEIGETEAQVIAHLIGHNNRVKAIELLAVAIPPYQNSKSVTYASTISSDGFIRLFDLDDVKQALSAPMTERPVLIEPVSYYDTKGSRLTCLTMADSESLSDDLLSTKEKRKRSGDDSGDDGERMEDGEANPSAEKNETREQSNSGDEDV